MAVCLLMLALDDVRIYNRALGAADVTTLYNLGTVPDTTPAGDLRGIPVEIAGTTATINWTVTDEPRTARWNMVSAWSYGFTTAPRAALVTTHSVNLSGLSASTPYHYRVKSKDAAGNPAHIARNRRSPRRLPNTQLPFISGVTVYSIGSSSATINWNTNERRIAGLAMA